MPAFHNGKGVGIPRQSGRGFPDPVPALKLLGWDKRKFHFQDWRWGSWSNPAIRDYYYPSVYSDSAMSSSRATASSRLPSMNIVRFL